MSYRIAGIDVHTKMLAVVVADVEGEGEYQFERRLFSSTPDHLRLLANWLVEQQVEEVVMESTAQYSLTGPAIRYGNGPETGLEEIKWRSPRSRFLASIVFGPHSFFVNQARADSGR